MKFILLIVSCFYVLALVYAPVSAQVTTPPTPAPTTPAAGATTPAAGATTASSGGETTKKDDENWKKAAIIIPIVVAGLILLLTLICCCCCRGGAAGGASGNGCWGCNCAPMGCGDCRNCGLDCTNCCYGCGPDMCCPRGGAGGDCCGPCCGPCCYGSGDCCGMGCQNCCMGGAGGYPSTQQMVYSSAQGPIQVVPEAAYVYGSAPPQGLNAGYSNDRTYVSNVPVNGVDRFPVYGGIRPGGCTTGCGGGGVYGGLPALPSSGGCSTGQCGGGGGVYGGGYGGYGFRR